MPEKVARQGQEPPANRRSTRASFTPEAHREAEHETPPKPLGSLMNFGSIVGNQTMQRMLAPAKTATTARMMAAHTTPTAFSSAESGESISAGELISLDTVQRQEAPTVGAGAGDAGTGGEGGGEGATSPDLISPRNRQISAERFDQAAAAYGSGDYITAIRLFTQIIEQTGLTGEGLGAIYWNLAQSQFRLRRYAAALFNFQRAVELGVTRTEVQQRIQECRTHLGIATDPSGDVVPISIEQARERFEQASAAYSRGDYITAARLFTQILESETSMNAQDRARIEYDIGMCNYRLERYSTAISYFEHALSVSGLEHEEQGRQYLTECRNRSGIGTGESGNVLTFVQQELRERFDQASAAYSAGDYSAALTLFTRIYEQDELQAESQAAILWNMAMCNYRMERWATALYMFRRYSEMGRAERGEELNRYLAECRQHLGIATDESGEIVPLSGEQGVEIFEQGANAYGNGDYVTAARRFTVLYDTGSATARPELAHNIGMCQYRLGRYAAAIPYFEEAAASGNTQIIEHGRPILAECRRRAGATPAPTSSVTEGTSGGT